MTETNTSTFSEFDSSGNSVLMSFFARSFLLCKEDASPRMG